MALIAGLRADIHNTAGKSFKDHFQPADFMPNAKPSIEDRVAEFKAMGYAPAAAVAMAHSSQDPSKRLHILDSKLEAAHEKKQKKKPAAPKRVKRNG